MTKLKIVIYIYIFLLLTGCSIQMDTSQKLVAPQNRLIPIKGKWEITKCLIEDQSSSSKADSNKWIGKNIQFSNQFVMLGNTTLSQPSYKSRKVNSEDYILYSYKPYLKSYCKGLNKLDVITVTTNDTFLCEVIKVSDTDLIIDIQNHCFYLRKISDKTDNLWFKKVSLDTSNDSILDSQEDEDLTRTGLVLGLRYPSRGNSPNKASYQYRTLWIAARNKNLNKILETKDILFPRRSGFWKIEVRKNNYDGVFQDDITAYNTSRQAASRGLTPLPLLTQNRTGYINRAINYVCNDFISIESVGSGVYKDTSQKWSENSLQIQPIDSLPVIKGVKISDISGEEGTEAMNLGIQRYIKSLKLENVNLYNQQPDEENFGVTRRMGHWFFKGKLHYRKGSNEFYSDYNINIIPSSKLVFYDDLNLTWAEIKDKVPLAIDAFTSPNKDIAVILTRDKLFVYGITKGKLEKTPLEKLDLKNKESVIMAEWATGSYVDNWEKIFVKCSYPLK